MSDGKEGVAEFWDDDEIPGWALDVTGDFAGDDMRRDVQITEWQEILPKVTRRGAFDIQVCVPGNYTDDQVKDFADKDTPSGTESGWHIRREGDKALAGDAERVPCETRAGCVHVMMDA